MFRSFRNRLHLTPTTVIATLALVFAMTGGAYAAKKYLITSTKQISPSVLKALQGKVGRAGAAGKNGANGTNGSNGAQGPAGPVGPEGKGTQGVAGATGKEGPTGKTGATGATGPEGKAATTLEAGQSEMGTWSMNVNMLDYSEVEGLHVGEAAISFPEPLPNGEISNIAIYFVNEKTVKTAECPGAFQNVSPVPGTLCVYGKSESPAISEQAPTGEHEYGFNAAQSSFHEVSIGSESSKSYGVGATVAFEQYKLEPQEGGFASGVWVLTAPEKA